VESLDPTFRQISRRLEWRLQRLFDRALDTKINLIRRGLERLRQEDHIADPAKFEALKEGAKNIEMQRRMALCMNVGQALSVWARMEEALVGVACVLLETKIEKAGIVMYSILNFNVWTSIIDELFTVDKRFDALVPKWRKIITQLGPLQKMRNNLAHHTINLPQDDATPIGDAALSPAPSDTRRQSQKSGPLDYNDGGDSFKRIIATTIRRTTSRSALSIMGSTVPLSQSKATPAPSIRSFHSPAPQRCLLQANVVQLRPEFMWGAIRG
jgi:hypothetical protein